MIFCYNNHVGDFINPFKELINDQIITIILADDEALIRKSTMKFLDKYANERNITLKIIEASDGIELIWVFYEKTMKNEKIDIIISDENMALYSGKRAAKEIYDIHTQLCFEQPRFFISSAYFIEQQPSQYINGYLHKPLLKDDLTKLFQ